MLREPGRTIILTGKKRFGSPKRFGKADVQVLNVRVKRGRLDLDHVLEILGDMGIASLLVEGGAAVQAAFLKAKVVDEIRLFLAPKIIGDFPSLRQVLNFESLDIETVGADLLLSARASSNGAH